MPKITVLPHEVLCPDGFVIENAPTGKSVCDILLENKIEIEHACEKSCACTTCHIYLREGYHSVKEPGEIEEDLLDQAWGLDLDSRLSCQTIIDEQDLVVEIPKYSINHAKENH